MRRQESLRAMSLERRGERGRAGGIMESRGDEKEARGGGTAAIEKDIQAYREKQMRGVDRVEV